MLFSLGNYREGWVQEKILFLERVVRLKKHFPFTPRVENILGCGL